MPASSDFLDGMLAQWEDQVPGLDTASLGIASRIRRLANYLEKRANKALAPLGLTLWQLDVLAVILLAPPKEGLHVNELLPAALLSPAAMTNRLDRLEQSGWIERLPDPADRRATRVRLTRTGRTLTRRALALRAADAASASSVLSSPQHAELAALLRLLLRSLCTRECPAQS
jgi:DNA-binding MarR family transcriptional regulator